MVQRGRAESRSASDMAGNEINDEAGPFRSACSQRHVYRVNEKRGVTCRNQRENKTSRHRVKID